MTIQEMHYDFDLKIDKVASFSREDFNRAQKDWLLNEAQDVFVKTRYSGNNPHKTAAEETQKRYDDLKNLLVKFPDQPALPLTDQGGIYELDLANLEYPYWIFSRGEVQVVHPNCTVNAGLKLIQNDDLNDARLDPFNKSDDTEVLFNFGKSSSNSSAGSMYLYPGTEALGNITIEYYKKPARMSFGNYVYIDGVTYPQQDCELSEHTHSEIVDIAVKIASGIIEHPNYVRLMQEKVFSHE